MQIFDIMFVVSGFATGMSLGLLPDPMDRKASHTAIWSLGFALGTYLLLLAVCANEKTFYEVAIASLLGGVAGYGGAYMMRADHLTKRTKPESAAKAADSGRKAAA